MAICIYSRVHVHQGNTVAIFAIAMIYNALRTIKETPKLTFFFQMPELYVTNLRHYLFAFVRSKAKKCLFVRNKQRKLWSWVHAIYLTTILAVSDH